MLKSSISTNIPPRKMTKDGPTPDELLSQSRSAINGNVPTTLRNLNVDSTKRGLEKEIDLPPSYQPSNVDVICGNLGSKEAYRHTGNERYRVLCEMRLQSYSRSTRKEKSDIVKEIVDAVREYGGRFVKREETRWVDIGNLRAREKTGHAIRAAMQKNNIPFRRSSSTESDLESKVSTPNQVSSGDFQDDSPLEAGTAIGLDDATTQYLSAFAAENSALAGDTGPGQDDHEPLPLEAASDALIDNREEPNDPTTCLVRSSDSEFLGYERVKRRRY